jgi:hypothetical protein
MLLDLISGSAAGMQQDGSHAGDKIFVQKSKKKK